MWFQNKSELHDILIQFSLCFVAPTWLGCVPGPPGELGVGGVLYGYRDIHAALHDARHQDQQEISQLLRTYHWTGDGLCSTCSVRSECNFFHYFLSLLRIFQSKLFQMDIKMKLMDHGSFGYINWWVVCTKSWVNEEYISQMSICELFSFWLKCDIPDISSLVPCCY